MTDIDTPGFLTEKDREFLCGEKTYDSKQGRYKRRKSIRDRTRAAFVDFSYLLEYLDDEEFEKIFQVEETLDQTDIRDITPEDCADGALNQYEYYKMFSDTVAMIFLAMRVIERQIIASPISANSKNFEYIVRRAVQVAASQRGSNDDILLTADVDIRKLDYSDVDEQRIAEKLAAGEGDELTDEELRYFFNKISNLEEFENLIPDTPDFATEHITDW